MYNFATMKVFKSFCDLIDDIANVNIFEYILGDDVVEVCLNELKYEIDISVIVGFYGVVEFNDVGVVDLSEDLYLAIGSLGICGVLEGVKYFFECIYFFSVFFFYFPDVTVCS